MPNPIVHQPTLLLRPEHIHLEPGCRIDSFVKVEGGQGVWVDRWVHVCSFAHINVGGGQVVLERGATVASHACILGGTNTPDGLYMNTVVPVEHRVERSVTWLKEGAFVGAGVVVLPGVTLGRFAVVGAGAVVTRDVPDGEIWVGNPARKLRDRWPKR